MNQPPDGSVPPVPEGSMAYYAVLFCPAPRRSGLTALFALERELEHITRVAAEPSIALVKLNWWAEEIQRLGAGQPRHPITTTLYATANDLGDVQTLGSVVQISQRMCHDPLRDANRSVELDCQRSSALFGFAAGWLAASAGGGADLARAAGAQLGAGVRLARLARDTAGAPAAELERPAMTALRDALASIPAALRATQVPLIVLAVLHLRALMHPGTKPDGQSRRRRAFESLGMITTAWRSARAASRGRLPRLARTPAT